MTKRFFRAKAAWIDGHRLAQNVVIAVANGFVEDIFPSSMCPIAPTDGSIVDVDLLLPGFINAHSHLEYSFCRGKLPRGKIPFTEWIEALTELKSEADESQICESASEAIREMVAGGVTTVLDCAHRPEMAAVLAESSVRHFIFWEVLGLTPEKAVASMAELVRKLELPRGKMCLGMGVNPHAPYSVGPDLRVELRDFLALHRDLATAWHLAEVSEEIELLETGAGHFAEFLERHGFPPPFEEVPKCSPLEFLQKAELFDRLDLAFHFNFFTKNEAKLFAPPRGVVHCPSTHRYFERDPWPISELLARGANVCLGTDSLASADTLNLFELLQQVGRDYPAVTGPQLLDFVTRNPARTRPLAMYHLGVITRKAPADFVALETRCSLSADLKTILIAPETRPVATFIAGEKVTP